MFNLAKRAAGPFYRFYTHKSIPRFYTVKTLLFSDMESKYLLNNKQDTEAFLTANNIAFNVSY